MKPIKIVAVVCFLCLCFAGTAFSQYRISTYPIPIMVESKEKGIFIELTREIINRTGENIEVVVYPTKRTINQFHNKKIIGFFPALKPMIRQSFSRSGAFSKKEDIIVVRREDKTISRIKELKGKRIGLTLGYPYASDLLNYKGIQIEYAKSDIINMKKLSRGRIDAMVIAKATTLKTIEEAGVTNVHYDTKKPIHVHDVFYAFQSSPEGKKLANLFSKALKSMKKDGTFKRIFSKHPRYKKQR